VSNYNWSDDEGMDPLTVLCCYYAVAFVAVVVALGFLVFA